MLLAPDSQGMVLQKLKNKRKRLQKRFENNPNEIYLALELKSIDDQIAGSKQEVQHEGRSSRSSAALTHHKLI